MPWATVEFPFVSGVDESIDRKILPVGMLSRMENYRIRREGTIARRWGYRDNLLESEYQDGTATDDETLVVRISSDRERRWVLTVDADREARVLAFATNEKWAELEYNCGDVLRAPVSGFRPLFRVRVSGVRMDKPALGCVGNFIAVAWVESGSVYRAVYDIAGSLVEPRTLVGTGTEVFIQTFGTRIRILYRDGSNLRASIWDTSGDLLWGAPVTLKSDLSATNSGWDAAVAADGEHFLVAYYDNVGDLRIVTYTAAGSVYATDHIVGVSPGALPGAISCAIYDGDGDSLVSYYDNGSGLMLVSYSGTTVSGNRAGPTVIDAAYSAFAPDGPTVVGTDGTKYWVAWGMGIAAGERTERADINTATAGATTRQHLWGGIPIGRSATRLVLQMYASNEQRQYVCRELPADETNGGGAGFVWVSEFRVAGLGQYTLPVIGPLCTIQSVGGVSYWAGTEVFDGSLSYSSTDNSIGVVVYRWDESSRVRGCHAWVGPAAHMVSGTHVSIGTRAVVQTPMRGPESLSAASDVLSGSLAAGTYYYQVVYAVKDSSGDVWRSAPSAVTSATLAGTGKITVTITDRPGYDCTAELYRQHTDGTYRFVRETAIPWDLAIASSVTVVDDGTSVISSAYLLYTEGGEPESYPTPTSDVCARWNGRLFVAADDRLYYSHAYDFADGSNAAPWMVESFYVQMQERITGLAPLDSALLILTTSGIYALTGDGPNRLGQNTYRDPQQISSEVGCVDWRSVVSFRDGVAFRSSRGLELIPRGGWAVQRLGDQLDDTLADYTETTQAVVYPELDQIRWTLRNDTGGIVAVYNYHYQQWSTETAPAYDCSSIWHIGDDESYLVGSSSAGISPTTTDGGLFSMVDGTYLDWTAPSSTYAGFASTLETGDIRPAGILGWNRVRTIDILGEVVGATTVSIAMAVDGSIPSDNVGSVAWTATGPLRQQYAPRDQRRESVRVRISEAGTEGTAGAELTALRLTVKPKRKPGRLAAAQRS